MNGSLNPLDPPVTHKSSHPHHSAPKWYFEFLEFCRAVVGLPTITAMVLEFLEFSPAVVRGGTVLALIVAVILRFFPKIKPWTVLPLLLSAILAVVFILFVAPFRSQKQSNLLATSWLNWEESLEKSSAGCNEGDAPCLATALVPVIDDRPRPVADSYVTRQASDVLAGELLLANYKARSLLNTRLSISKQFVGSGFSEPIGQSDPAAARIPEYLAPNVSVNDNSKHVWFWELDEEQIVGGTRIIDHKLLDVLMATPTANHADFKKNWTWVSQHLQRNDSRPALVRFARLDPRKASGCIGRNEATRVFMSDLGEVAATTIDSATRNSGYVTPAKNDDPNIRLLIWVYAPEEEAQAVRATWGNVLANFGTWVTAEPCNHSH